jgi:regulator of cell morphogenesis and NO signaling
MHLDMTLADIVTTQPSAAPTLERHHLDYCCGGRQTLVDACTANGLDARAVLDELKEAPAEREPDWAAMSPTELVDHLEATHHRYLHDELPRLAALAVKVAGVHASRHPELNTVADLVLALRADLEPHLAKEEHVLFPMIRELAAADVAPAFHCGTLANPIRMMLLEHDRAGDLLAALRAATDDHTVPADGCASYRALYAALVELEADTHLHVHKENNILFPAVLALELQRGALDEAAREHAGG